MTGNPNAQVVTEDSNQAQIADAIAHNAQTVQEATVTEAAVLTEQKQVHAQATETQGPSQGGGMTSGLLGRASSAGGSLSAKESGANRASVYGDMACDAVGLSAVAQAGKMLCDAAKEYKNPFAHGSAKTFDQVISEGASKPALGGASSNSKKSSIFTGSFNKKAAIPGRAQGVNNFMQGEDKVKGVQTTETMTATLSKKRELSCSAKMLSKTQLGNAKACEAKVGAKVAKAQQMGVAPAALNHSGMGSGPKFVEPKETVVDDSSSSWA